MKIPQSILAYPAGMLFSAGIWMWIDAHVYSKHVGDDIVNGLGYIPVCVGILGLIVLQILPPDRIAAQDDLGGNERGRAVAILWFTISFLILLASLAAALGIMITKLDNDKYENDTKWPPIAMLLCSICTIVSAMMLWLGRVWKPPGTGSSF
eukprot:gb/GECH01011492.1/.p1 GENE.gb/GECH01011492.1/~~gb/GECH01011492.1/.p1  ORF type:complete len:152 (+),score=24.96 gb/GECH01011492.1/:1-456(+)